MAEGLAVMVPALAGALLHFLWQGALIGALAALLLALLRSARPELRYAVAGLALLVCVVMPLVTLALALADPPTATALEAESARQLTPASAGSRLLALQASSRFASFAPWIAASWAAGASLLLARLALGLSWVGSLRRRRESGAHPAWQERFRQLARRFGLTRPIELRLVDGLDSPVSAGWWRPMVVFPAALLTRLPPELVEALLAHELAHIRRHDYLVNLLQNVAEALLFYHPVTWWLSRRLRVERELVADRLAAEVTGEPRRLAVALSELAELRACLPRLHLAQAAGRGELSSRIEQLLRPRRPTHPGLWLVLPLLASAAVALVTQGAALSEARRAKEADPARLSFALVPADRGEVLAWGPDDDIHLAAADHRRPDRAVLLVRRGGRDFLVTEPQLLDPVQRAWGEAEALRGRLDRGYPVLGAAEIVTLEREVGAAYTRLPRILRRAVEQAWAAGLAQPAEPRSG